MSDGGLIEALDGGTLRLSGRLRRDQALALAQALVRARPARGQSLLLDLSAVDELDSAVVAVLVDGWRKARDAGVGLHLGPASDSAERALSMFRLNEREDPAPRRPGAIEGMGGAVIDGAASLRELVQLTADTVAGMFGVVIHPRRMRWPALVDQCVYIGSQALPIVALISFLIGLTLAFQSAYQLRQFGAPIYVADLTGVSMVREMGPLMTAILVAGRSGSSIAAEVSTMKVSEEIDALEVMGLDPIHFLAVPRVMAIVAVMPLLSTLATAMGIFGGFLVGVFYLDIAAPAFLGQLFGALEAKDLATSILKSMVFAFGIALIGLFYGFRVRGGAGEVGRTTTASVVSSIFFIIIADCTFSVVFYILI